MKQIGGAYLNPFTLIHKDYEPYWKGKEQEFWLKYNNELGKEIVRINHFSTFKKPDNNQVKIESEIIITSDGLILTELPDISEYIEDCLNALKNHLNSFLGTLNLAGSYFNPFKENDLNSIVLSSENNYNINSGNPYDLRYQTIPLDRIKDRNEPIYKKRTNTINYFLPEKLVDNYKYGNKIQTDLALQPNTFNLALYSLNYFTYRNWDASLLLGWAFIESIIDQIWTKKIIKDLSGNRKDRLKDFRTYSVAVKLEFLLRESIIQNETYEYLNHLRKLRNDLIHKGESINKHNIDLIFPYTNKLISCMTDLVPGINRQGSYKIGDWIKGKRYRED